MKICMLFVSVILMLGLVACAANVGGDETPPVNTWYYYQDDYEIVYNEVDDFEVDDVGAVYMHEFFPAEGIIEITNPGFASQVQFIHMDRYNLLGRTIRFEGMFMTSQWEDETIYVVARMDGGCCGLHGFEVYLNEFPRLEDETWVEVTGILEMFYVEEISQYFLRLNVVALEER